MNKNTYDKNLKIVTSLSEEINIYDKTNYFSLKGYSEIDKDIKTLFNILNIILEKDYNINDKLTTIEFYRNNNYSLVTKSYMMNIINYIEDKIRNDEFIKFIEDAL